VIRAAEFCFCVSCFSKEPRYRQTAWKHDCCDGVALVGPCLKHILAAVGVASCVWPTCSLARGAELQAAPEAWHQSQAAKGLRPPNWWVAARVRV
jgi:hypothetical protein